MGKILLLFILIINTTIRAQDPILQSLKQNTLKKTPKDPNDTTLKKLKLGGLFNINISSASLSNWSAGGDNFSLSLNSHVNAFAYYKHGRYTWDNVMEVNLGYLKSTGLGERKNDDRVDILSKYGYALQDKLNLTVLFNLRSQFFKGYTYSTSENGKVIKSLTSNLFAPGYVLLGAGMDYRQIPQLSLFVSPITSRWTILADASLSAKGSYGVDTGKRSYSSFGAYASVNYSTVLNKILEYTARIDLFSNYRNRAKNMDLYMTNLLTIKLSKVLSATWNVDLIYDDDVKLFGPNNDSPGLQCKSLIGVGLLLSL